MSMPCYLISRSSLALLDGRVVEEVWKGNDVNFSGLKILSCLAYVHVPNDEMSKLDLKL